MTLREAAQQILADCDICHYHSPSAARIACPHTDHHILADALYLDDQEQQALNDRITELTELVVVYTERLQRVSVSAETISSEMTEILNASNVE